MKRLKNIDDKNKKQLEMIKNQKIQLSKKPIRSQEAKNVLNTLSNQKKVSTTKGFILK